MVTIGAGGTTFWHSMSSLQGKISKPLQLLPTWMLAGIFGLFVALGLFISENNFAIGLFFPPILLIAAILPPLLAIAWFTNQEAEGLTWRRSLVAFAGGATVSVILAIILEILFPTIILALVFNLADIVINGVEVLLEALAGKSLASAITSRGFMYVFIQVTIIAPLAEELVKPLVTLPLIGRLSRRTAFLVGAMAGAGFAALENLLYAGLGFFFWAGILVVRALGGAIHPLCSGLVTLGWRDILRGEANAWPNWFARFGIAVGIHAFWNGGSLLVITLAGAQFFGELPPEIDVLGLSAAGTTLALLIILGLVALWIGRSTAQKLKSPDATDREPSEAGFTLSDRMVAIWALACLVAIVPMGITGLQILMK
jgi:RsiW-degrading membrane proteinase PrsW (M82 family)